MHRELKRIIVIMFGTLILTGFTGCTSQADKDARAAEEASRYQSAYRAWTAAHPDPTTATLQGSAASAVAGKIKVADIETEAARVFFAIDGSGSMMEAFARVRIEIQRVIKEMPPTMCFNIVVFADDGSKLFKQGYVFADDKGKRDAEEYLNRVGPHGSSDPVPAFRTVFAASPDVVFVLTDGDFPNSRQLLEEISKSNAVKKVRINTIATMRSDDYDKLLRQIAEENGGRFARLGG